LKNNFMLKFCHKKSHFDLKLVLGRFFRRKKSFKIIILTSDCSLTYICLPGPEANPGFTTIALS
jgi:hypothetical protein